MSNEIKGGCHCGAVQYKVSGELVGVIHCHCGDCRRWHGHYSAYAVANLSEFEITQGKDKLSWYESSEKARRGFCPDCGSSVFKDNKDGEKIVISVGTIDSPTNLKFMKNIFDDSKGDYYTLPE